MAGSDEFVEAGSGLFAGKGVSCAVSGEPAPELVAPTVRFARAHLVARIRGFSAHEPVFVHSEGEPLDARRLEHIEINIDARSVLGEIAIWNNSPAVGLIVDTYCTHVTCTATSCSIVVESLPYEGVAG